MGLSGHAAEVRSRQTHPEDLKISGELVRRVSADRLRRRNRNRPSLGSPLSVVQPHPQPGSLAGAAGSAATGLQGVCPKTKAPIPIGGRGLLSRSWCHHHSPRALKSARGALRRAISGANRCRLLVRSRAHVHQPAQGCRAEYPAAALTASAPLSGHRDISAHGPFTATVFTGCCQPLAYAYTGFRLGASSIDSSRGYPQEWAS